MYDNGSSCGHSISNQELRERISLAASVGCWRCWETQTGNRTAGVPYDSWIVFKGGSSLTRPFFSAPVPLKHCSERFPLPARWTPR